MDEWTPLKDDNHDSKVTFDATLSGDHDNYDNNDNNNNNNNNNTQVVPAEQEDGEPITPSLRRRRSRDAHHRRDSSALDNVMESLHEMADIVVETFEDVQHAMVEGMEEFQEVLDEPIAVPIKPREEGDHSQKLSAVAVAVLVFYKVSGGPFGCEPGVKAAGPFYTLLGYIVFPIIWCIPEALITAELGSAFPEPSGCKYSYEL
jgi:hypothetical protein